MKTFKNFILEDGGSQIPTDGLGLFASSAGLSSEKVPHDIDDADVKAKVNAILGQAAVSEWLNPKACVAQMEAKLSLLGLNKTGESDIEFTEGNGSFDIQFNRYGVVTGKTVDTPHDEFEREEKIVSLNVKYEQNENGTYKVIGSLV
jgi:hypothetical protein